MARKPLDLSGNPNLRDLLSEAHRQGLEVYIAKRTGEVKVRAEWAHVTCNNRRKDGARALVVLLREGQRRERTDDPPLCGKGPGPGKE
jgi:hypothetical protein